MKTAIGLAMLVLAAGCSTTVEPAASRSSESSLLASDLKLPDGDPCRRVIAPLAVGLAQGAVGLGDTTGITVSLTSATDSRDYTVVIDHAGASERYSVSLSNDSALECFVESVRSDPGATLAGDVRSPATVEEVDAVAPVTVSPSPDACARTVEFLADGVGKSAVGEAGPLGVIATLEGETASERKYVAHVDGESFAFEITLSNEPATRCAVRSVEAR